ncbi:MAG: sigma-E factor regulatory protein RseB domain-containing protein [Vulcanimicrobiaceae bacterium]
MLNRNHLAFALLVVASLIFTAPVIADDDAATLLRAAVDAPNQQTYVGEVQIVDIGTAHADASVYRVEHRPHQTRRWYLAPRNLFGDSLYLLGDSTYAVDVKARRIIVTKNDAREDGVALAGNLNLLLSNYRAYFAPDASVAGRHSRVIVLANKYTGQTAMRVWIDQQTHLVLESERYNSSGALYEQSRFESIRYVASLPAQTFTTPTGMPRVQGASHNRPSNDPKSIIAHAGFSVSEPSYLPDGFVPVAGDISSLHGVRTLHLLYSDGLRSISLFEARQDFHVVMTGLHPHDVHVGTSDGQLGSSDSTSILAWERSGIHYELVGAIARYELLKIGASVSAR